MGFSHLHVHSEYSMLDGLARVKDLIEAAHENGMSSIALTDHGNLYGAIEFYKAAIKRDENRNIIFNEDGYPEFFVKPIIGCEVYTAARTRFDKEKSLDRRSGHLVLLVKNKTGYINLSKIVTDASTNTYYRPRTDIEFLREHSEGLIALSACIAGDVPQKLIEGDYEGAKKLAIEYQDIFGEGNYYIEIQDHEIDDEKKIRSDLIRLSRETKIPLVATNDVHYVSRQDATVHDLLLCIQTNSKVYETERFKFSSDQFYIRTEDEMRALFPDIPEAIDNTEKIADMCNFHFELKSATSYNSASQNDSGDKYFPTFFQDSGLSNKEYLYDLCEKGLKFRYGDESESKRERLEYELSVIGDMGFTDYFLIVWDYIRFARDNGIAVGPGRGSAAGSIVAYVLRITDLDPISYGLIFERFLNPERVSMPDIDVDFCKDRRDEVIAYVREKYGNSKVSNIITFNTMQAKGVIRDIGRVLDTPLSEVERFVKLLPKKARNLSETISGETKNSEGELVTFYEEREKFVSAYENDQQLNRIMEYATVLEGRIKSQGTHAAGIVICKEDLQNCIPLYFDEKTGTFTASFNMSEVEDLGLLKMDFLALRNLTLISDTVSIINNNKEKNDSEALAFNIDSLSFDDKEVFSLVAKGDTEGVFQLENSGMQSFMRQLKPNCFEDLIVGISMYRPGPMNDIPTYLANRKKKNVKYTHHLLKPILEETYGVMVYQEQVMRIVRDLAGFSFGKSDEIRRAMSKKKESAINRERKNFIEGSLNNGVPESDSSLIFNQMISFAQYAFNKSHAAVYSVISYQTAYLKTHYPKEFLAALMSSVIKDSEKVTKYIYSARDMGINVVLPDILKAQKLFSVSEGNIVMGLQAVKNAGEKAIEAIIYARENNEISTFREFISCIDTKKVSSRTIESLIFAGAFDSFDTDRNKLLQEYTINKNTMSKIIPGQVDMFSQIETIPSDAGNSLDFSESERMEKEKEMLGFYFTKHPLDSYKELIDCYVTANTYKLKNLEANQDQAYISSNSNSNKKSVLMIGIINSLAIHFIKSGKNKGKEMAIIELEDHFGIIKILVFSEAFEKCKSFLSGGISTGEGHNNKEIVTVRGRVTYEDGTPSINAKNITPIEVLEKYHINMKQEYEAEFGREKE